MTKKMNLGRFSIAALILAVVAAIVGFNFYETVSAQTSDEKAVRDVLMREAAAVEKGDLAALDKIWASDESVTIFENGGANYGWKDYRDNHLAPELKNFKNTKYTMSDVKVKVSGKTAWATFKYALAADAKERRVDVSGLGTAVLEKRGKDWQIVHWNTSATRRAPSPSPSPKS